MAIGAHANDARSLLSVAEARALVRDSVVALEAETVAVPDALDRFLASDVTAAADVPGFANSAMDGFALLAGPAGRRLAIVGESRAGAPSDGAVGPGQAMRISTGAALPPGADAVLEVEASRVEGEELEALAAVEAGRHVRRPGEDLAAGETVLRRGIRLGPAALGLATSAGRAELEVTRRPRVGIVVTGDELVAAGRRSAPARSTTQTPSPCTHSRRAAARVSPSATTPTTRPRPRRRCSLGPCRRPTS